MKKVKLAVAIAIPLAVGGLAGFLTRGGMERFEELEKPLLSPPAWVFPVAWTILYVLMGIASYLVYEKDYAGKKEALTIYALQLAVNFVWPFLFFGAGWYAFSFAWLVFLWYLVYECMRRFSAASHAAAFLLLPYLLWLSFAGYLNLYIAIKN